MSEAYETYENEKVRLQIERDEVHETPRDWDGNVGLMICWHRNYKLGDDHAFDDSTDLLNHLIEGAMDYQSYLQPHLERKFAGLHVAKNESDVFYIAHECGVSAYTHEYGTAEEAQEELDGYKQEWLDEEWKDELGISEKRDIVEATKQYVLMPLYLYDHSGITMNTTGFSCSWDSGQVGIIYTNREMLEKHTGELKDDEWQERAHQELVAEVKIYDQYLTGDVYYFSLEKKTHCEDCGTDDYEHIDSCGGFYGDDVKTNGMMEHLPDYVLPLIDGKEYNTVYSEKHGYLTGGKRWSHDIADATLYPAEQGMVLSDIPHGVQVQFRPFSFDLLFVTQAENGELPSLPAPEKVRELTADQVASKELDVAQAILQAREIKHHIQEIWVNLDVDEKDWVLANVIAKRVEAIELLLQPLVNGDVLGAQLLADPQFVIDELTK